MAQKIIRVFPRKTIATPDDEYCRYDIPRWGSLKYCEKSIDPLFPYPLEDECDEVHISVTFTYDIPRAEKLAKAWEKIAPVKIGGPGMGMRGEEFVPGMYLKHGWIITSRGCPNRCWFCSVWKRDGTIRELPIRDGWIVQDDNLLACSEDHIRKVFEMLHGQKKLGKPIQFGGGLEAKLLQDWHIDLLAGLKPKQMFFAYDTPDDLEPLLAASPKLLQAGLKNSLRCYVLIGHPKDTFELAEQRMKVVFQAGFFPFAMLYKNSKGEKDAEWMKFARLYSRPAISRKLLQQK